MSRTSAIVNLCALAIASACDRDGNDTLDGREFVSESIEGHELIGGTRVILRFGGYFSASAGCNSLSSDHYRLSGGELVTGGLGMTEKGCSSPYGDLHAQDEWVRGFLKASPTYELDEPRLVLSDDDVTLVLLDREVAEPDLSLEGREWRVEGLLENGGLGVFAADFSGSVVFTEDGAVAIATPCAMGEASYVLGASTLVVSDMTIAEPVCPADEFASKVDEHMRLVFADGALDFEIERDRLTIEHGDVGLTLRAE